MPVGLMIITLTKEGFGKAPDFILKVLQNGFVSYEGFGKVSILGKFETTIEPAGFAELLSLVKEMDFFGLKDDYSLFPDEVAPRTKITVSIPVETGETKEKTITFFQKDPTVPEELTQFEKKILEVADFENWTKKKLKEPEEAVFEKVEEAKVEFEKVEEEKVDFEKVEEPEIKLEVVEEKPAKTPIVINKNILVLIIVILVSVTALAAAFDFGYLDFSNDAPKDNPVNGNQSNTSNNSFVINKLLTASQVSGLGQYTEQDSFAPGETIFVYLEYDGFTIDDSCDVTLEILIKQALRIKQDPKYISNTTTSNCNKIEQHWSIPTDETWNTGLYYGVVIATNNIVNETLIETFTFHING